MERKEIKLRKFTEILFFGGTDAEKKLKELKAIFNDSLNIASALQQPTHSSNKKEAEEALKINKECDTQLIDNLKDITKALTGEYWDIITEETQIDNSNKSKEHPVMTTDMKTNDSDTAKKVKTLPSDFTNLPWSSVLNQSEYEVIALNIMEILKRTGNIFRKLTWEEYTKERLKDGGFSGGEYKFFIEVLPYCRNANTAKLFSKTWAD